MKHGQFFDAFLNDEVNLNQSRLDRLNTSVSAVAEYLSQNLELYWKTERQGSHALRTIIKPVQDAQEYDADMLLYLKYDDTKEPKAYINEVYDCLRESKVYEEKAHRKTRCVFLDYAGDFHLDIIPCFIAGNQLHYICNNKTNEFERTDGTGYRDWFDSKNKVTHGNLKRVTRLLKYLRDHKGNFTAKSILLTTLIGNTVRHQDEDGKHFKSLPDALVTVSNRINDYLQNNPRMPKVVNPVLPAEDFTRHWDQDKYDNFRRLFKLYRDKINCAFDTVEHDDSVEKWREVFGEKFGRKRGGNGTGGGQKLAAKAPFVAVRAGRPHAW